MFRIPPEFGPGGGAQHKCDKRNIGPAVNNACTDVFRRLDADFGSFMPEVQPLQMDNIRNMIRRRIHLTGTDQAMAQPHNDEGSFDEDFLQCIPEELLE